jgi:hypothetical protein
VSLWCHPNGRRLTGQCTNTKHADTRIYVTSFCLLFAKMPHNWRTITSFRYDVAVAGWLRHRIHISRHVYFCMLPCILPLWVRILPRPKEYALKEGGYGAACRNSHDITSKYVPACLTQSGPAHYFIITSNYVITAKLYNYFDGHYNCNLADNILVKGNWVIYSTERVKIYMGLIHFAMRKLVSLV